MSIFRRSWTLGVTLAVLLVPAGCGGRADEPQADEDAAAETRPTGGGDGDLAFVPTTYSEGDRVVLPITFPDGTRAELVYPPELEIAELGVFPYSSGTLQGKSPTPGRGDSIARDFLIRYGDLDEVLEVWNRDGGPPKLLTQYEGADGQTVGLWDLGWNETAHYLGFQFGRWTVLVYDYIAAGAMTDAERTLWAASFAGQESDAGFLLLEGSGPLRLARAGEHAGPQLTFSAGDPTRALLLYPGECRPHREQTLLFEGKLVQWKGGFADWCLSHSMRIHAEGSKGFIRALIDELDVRNVTIARS